MTKRIIDNMSAEQIAKGCSNGARQDTLVEYLESICKPAPTWDEICIALEKLKNDYPDKGYWERERERWSYNRAIDDVIKVLKNH